MVTPMCTKKPPAVSDGSTEGANNAPSDATKALMTELETTHMRLKVNHLTHPCLMCPHCTPATQCIHLHLGQRATHFYGSFVARQGFLLQSC